MLLPLQTGLNPSLYHTLLTESNASSTGLQGPHCPLSPHGSSSAPCFVLPHLITAEFVLGILQIFSFLLMILATGLQSSTWHSMSVKNWTCNFFLKFASLEVCLVSQVHPFRTPEDPTVIRVCFCDPHQSYPEVLLDLPSEHTCHSPHLSCCPSGQTAIVPLWNESSDPKWSPHFFPPSLCSLYPASLLKWKPKVERVTTLLKPTGPHHTQSRSQTDPPGDLLGIERVYKTGYISVFSAETECIHSLFNWSWSLTSS